MSPLRTARQFPSPSRRKKKTCRADTPPTGKENFRSALVAILSIPLSILLAFVVMRMQGLGANIMSLGGIAISIGVLVDAAIIMVENAHKHYEEWRGKRSHFEIILRSAQEVGPTLLSPSS